MTFVSDKRAGIRRLGIGASLVLAGTVVGAVGVFAIAARNQPTQQEFEALRLQDAVEYQRGRSNMAIATLSLWSQTICRKIGARFSSQF